MTERPGDRDERLGRASVLPLADPDRETERWLGLCRAPWDRETDGEERRLLSRRTDDGRLSRGAGVEDGLTDSCREDRPRETSSRRERGLGADVATRSVVRPGRRSRLDACDEGRDDFFAPDLGFDREPPLAFGREPPLAFGRERDGFEGLAREGSDLRAGFEGLAREGSDLRVGFVDLAREGSELRRGVEAPGRSRVWRGLAIFL